MPPSRVMLRWNAYEHEHVVRSRDWYWALGITAICIALISIIFHDVLFALLIIIAAATIGMLSTIPPKLVQFEVSERGIRVGGLLHRYDEIVSFWVEDEHHNGRPILLVDTVKFMSPNIVIPLENIEPHIVRNFLMKHIDEVPMTEPASHKILESFGL